MATHKCNDCGTKQTYVTDSDAESASRNSQSETDCEITTDSGEDVLRCPVCDDITMYTEDSED